MANDATQITDQTARIRAFSALSPILIETHKQQRFRSCQRQKTERYTNPV